MNAFITLQEYQDEAQPLLGELRRLSPNVRWDVVGLDNEEQQGTITITAQVSLGNMDVVSTSLPVSWGLLTHAPLSSIVDRIRWAASIFLGRLIVGTEEAE